LLTTLTLEKLSQATVDAVNECARGVGADDVQGDPELQAIRDRQLKAADALRDAYNALSALKSDEVTLGIRRAIRG
jgi:hypothetical protein